MDKDIQQSFDRDAVHSRMIDLANACEPHDPFEGEPTAPLDVALASLTDLLGNVTARTAAEGIYLALLDLYARWSLDHGVRFGLDR